MKATWRRALRERYLYLKDREQILPLVLLLVVLGLGVGYWAGRPIYHRWRTARAAEQAAEFLAWQDLGGARLALATALRDGPDERALRLLADFQEQSGSPLAVGTRRELWRRHPDDLAARLALAGAALRFRDLPTARLALAGATAGQKREPAFLRTAAALALLDGASVEADALLGELRGHGEVSPEVRLLHATVQLRARAPGAAAAARTELLTLARDPTQAAAAYRVLLADAFARRDPLDAADFGRALAAAPEATFGDWLDVAAARRLAAPTAPLDPALQEKIVTRAESDPALAVHYVRWIASQFGPDPAAGWLESRAALAEAPALRAIRADLALARGRWETLRPLLLAGAWGELPRDSIEFAYAAHLARQLGAEDTAAHTWDQALDDARDSAPALRALRRLAAAWNWAAAERAALRDLAVRFPEDGAAYADWVARLRAEGDSAGLLEALRRRLPAEGALPDARQDWALLSLLVAPARAPNDATRTLEVLFQSEPTNAFFVTNHAFALWQLGRTAEAAALVAQLAPTERTVPARAPYLAVILASAGRSDEAREVLRRAPPRAALLREEVALLKKAEEVIAR